MTIQIKRIEESIAEAPQEMLIWHFLSLLQLQPESVDDPQNAASMMHALCLAQTRAAESMFALIAQTRFDFRQKFLQETKTGVRSSTLKRVTSHVENPFELASALFELSCYASLQDAGLARKFLRHEDGRVRAASVELFIRSTPIEELQSAIAWLCDPLEIVAHHTAFILSGYPREFLIKGIRRLASSREVSRRQAALRALARLPAEDSFNGLLATLSRDPLPVIRLESIDYLAERSSPITQKRLKELSSDIEIHICEKASEALENPASPSRPPLNINPPLILD